MTLEPPRLGDLLAHVVAAQVEFVLVGGLAVNAWGYLRGTVDVDLVPEPGAENLDRLGDALAEINGKVKVGDRLLAVSSTRTYLHAGDRALVVTDLGECDVLQGLPHIPRYAALKARASAATLHGLSVEVCSLEHLLEMKRIAGRHRDQDDIEALEAAYPDIAGDQ